MTSAYTDNSRKNVGYKAMPAALFGNANIEESIAQNAKKYLKVRVQLADD